MYAISFLLVNFTAQQAGFLKLPDDILSLVFSFVSPTDVRNCSTLSKSVLQVLQQFRFSNIDISSIRTDDLRLNGLSRLPILVLHISVDCEKTRPRTLANFISRAKENEMKELHLCLYNALREHVCALGVEGKFFLVDFGVPSTADQTTQLTAGDIIQALRGTTLKKLDLRVSSSCF